MVRLGSRKGAEVTRHHYAERMLTSRLYTDGLLVRQDLPIEELATAAAGDGCALWVDCMKTDVDTVHRLAELFQLHPVAVEDALGEHERPKLDRYENHVFAIAYSTRLRDEPGGKVPVPRIDVHALSIFGTSRVLITIRPEGALEAGEAAQVWEAHPELLKEGSAAMLWAFLDQIVDSHFDTVQQLEECTSDIEEVVFTEATDIRGAQRHLYELHKRTAFLRRITIPTRDIVGGILRFGASSGSIPALTPYFQDVYDHCMRVADWSDSLHDTISTLFDSTLSSQSNRMNLVMKKVTSWAAIIAVPTLVTGFFGMNVSFPLFGTAVGWWVALGLMFVPSGVLYYLFRRNDWL